MSRPATCTTPELGGSRPPRICSSVVLPEPEAPTIATRSAGATESPTPCSTSSTTGPWRKLLCTSRASSTGSFMAQRLGGCGARRAPRGVERGEHAQHQRHRTHFEHIDELDVGRQVAHVVDARVEELRPEQALEPRDQCFEVVREQRAERGPGDCAGEADEHALHREGEQHVARPGTESAQYCNVRL